MKGTPPPFRPLAPITVVADAKAVQAAFIVCYRVDGPETGPITRHLANTRLIKPCCRCGADLFVSPVSPADIPVICRPCIELQIDLSDTSKVCLMRTGEMEAEAVRARSDYRRDKAAAAAATEGAADAAT